MSQNSFHKLEEISEEIESQVSVIEELCKLDPYIRDFYVSYRKVEHYISEGYPVSEYVEDQVVGRWIRVIKDRVNINIH